MASSALGAAGTAAELEPGPGVAGLATPAMLPIAVETQENQKETIPKLGDRVMILKEPSLWDILGGRKTMEIRCKCISPGFAWLGMGGKVYGRVNITSARRLTIEEFRSCTDAHMWPEHEPPPFKTLCGLTLSEPHALPDPIPYWRPQAPIGWNKFRTCEKDLPPKRRKRKRTDATPDAECESAVRRESQEQAGAVQEEHQVDQP